jgi:tripartite-type tricarboxylate transporter receptor subunit TctC
MMTLARALLLAMLALPGDALAQSKPIQLIVPFAPGASSDGIARAIAPELGTRIGRTVVIENKAGAGGTLGLIAVSKAPPDGDTLTLAATGALVINPHIPNATPIDPLRDVIAVAKLIEIPLVLVSNPTIGPKSVNELLERAKQSPNGLSYGTTGVNSGQHLSMELFKKATGANLVHIPYRGSAPTVTDLLGGQIPVACVDITSAFPHIQAGNLIALGLMDKKRTPLAPDIPTIAEVGVPGFGREGGFMGIFAPPGTPAATVKRLSREIGEILKLPDVLAKVRLLTVQASYLDDEEFTRFLAAESAKWKQALQSVGLTN